MPNIILVIFGETLNFTNYTKVKNLFLQKKLNINPYSDTDRIIKKVSTKENIKSNDLIEIDADGPYIFSD